MHRTSCPALVRLDRQRYPNGRFSPRKYQRVATPRATLQLVTRAVTLNAPARGWFAGTSPHWRIGEVETAAGATSVRPPVHAASKTMANRRSRCADVEQGVCARCGRLEHASWSSGNDESGRPGSTRNSQRHSGTALEGASMSWQATSGGRSAVSAPGSGAGRCASPERRTRALRPHVPRCGRRSWRTQPPPRWRLPPAPAPGSSTIRPSGAGRRCGDGGANGSGLERAAVAHDGCRPRARKVPAPALSRGAAARAATRRAGTYRRRIENRIRAGNTTLPEMAA